MANITKRKHDDGSLAYRIKVYRGKNPETGKHLTPYSTTWSPPSTWTEKRADKEAERQAMLFEESCRNGDIIVNEPTFFSYAEYVIQQKEANGIKHKTILMYKRSLSRVSLFIGYLKISRVSPMEINKMKNKLLHTPCANNPQKTLSPKTVKEDLVFISAVFSFAIKEGIVRDNPVSRVEKPVIRKKTPNYYQPATVREIAIALEKAPIKWKTFTHLLLLSGARRGEICGLKWDGINWDDRTISIKDTILYSSERGIYIDTTKEDNPHVVKLPEETMLLLKSYRSWYKEQRLIQGDRWVDSGFIFVKENGAPMHPDSITGWLSKFGKKNNLPHLNPHAFRHTHASLLYYAGEDSVTISNRLGHSQVSTTQNIYAHIIQDANERAAECAADIILRNNYKDKNRSS